MKSYKQRALDSLSGNWGLAIGVTLIYGLVSGIASQAYGVGTIFIGLPLLVGMTYFFINLVRGGHAEFDDLIEGFRTNYIENIFTIFLMQLYTALWMMLLIVPGIIKTFSYAMVPYIMADPKYNLTYNDAITESRRLMDGRKMDLFMLYLSFIGWILLGIVTFGIAFLWIQPYMIAATTAFYLEMTGEHRTKLDPPVGGRSVFEQEQPQNEEKPQKEEDEWDF